MTKTFCDICGEESEFVEGSSIGGDLSFYQKESSTVSGIIRGTFTVKFNVGQKFDVCRKCLSKAIMEGLDDDRN